MSLDEEPFYVPFYLFNAVLEYIYFIIIHIQNNGPKPAVDIQRHLKFYKCEVTKFVNTFCGKDEIEKCVNMLCFATPIFYSFNDMIYLSKDFMYFKQLIYEDLILSNTTDIVLKGTKNISEICKVLNGNNLIKTNENALMSILKQYSFFYENKSQSVIILPYSWLDSFNQAFYNIEQYFLSILQNIHVMPYKDVAVHSDFIPSCGIHSYLTTFCILTASSIFKCKNSNLYLNNKGKRMKCQSQQLNIVRLETTALFSGITTSLLVRVWHGKKICNWFGEVSRVMKNSGLLYCSAYFKDFSHDFFAVYFHKKALKSISEIKNLSNFVSIRDIVAFDAVYQEGIGGRYWQATKLKIVKQSFKPNLTKCEIDVDEYKKLEYSSLEMNTVINTGIQRKCLCKYCKYKKTLNFSQDFIPNNEDEFREFLKRSFNFSDSELNLNFLSPKIEYSDNCYNQAIKRNKTKRPSNSNLKENPSDCYMVDNVEKQSTIQVKNSLVLHYTFVFGEIESASKYFGIINASSDNNSYTVYFHKSVLVSLDGFDDLKEIKKCEKVLAFISNIDKDACPVASLVFLLNSNEISLISKNKICPSKFVFGYFLPRMETKCSRLLHCFNLSHVLTFDMPFNFATNKINELRRMSSTFLITLTEIYNINITMQKKILNFVTSISKRNRIAKYCKSFSTISSFFHFLFLSVKKPKFNHKFANKCPYFKYLSMNNVKKHAFNHIQHRHSLNSFQCKILCASDSQYDDYDLKLKDPDSKSYLKPDTDSSVFPICKNSSCSSLGSYFSCSGSSCIKSPSCLSDDSFFSCNSSSGSLTCNSVAMQEISSGEQKPLCAVSHSTSLPQLYQPSTQNLNFQTVNESNNYLHTNVMDKEMHSNQKLKLNPKSLLPMKVPRNRKRPKYLQEITFCENNFRFVIETVARVCIITTASLFLIPENNRTLTLCFPKKLIPVKIQSKIKINSEVRITYIPCVPLNLSHVLSLETND